jgi:alpha-galactosidase
MIKKSCLLLLMSLFIFSCQTKEKKIMVDAMDLSTMEVGRGSSQSGKSSLGNPLTVRGKVFEKGIGTSAGSKYLIGLDGKAVRFTAKVGIDDSSRRRGGAKFYILGDKKILWESKVMHKGDTAADINIPLKKVMKLAMYVAEDAGAPAVDWIEPSITYHGNLPVPLSFKTDSSYILTPPVADAPRINGAKITGATPGRPFLFRVPVTGKSPVNISLTNLPAGLNWDTETRVISGTAPAKGEYIVKITAKNNAGSVERELKIVTGKGLALTPPLGWNSWNCWGMAVDQEKVKASADAMMSSGLADHGWTYINIDDGWEAEKRTPVGELLSNEKFPDMKALGNHIHNYGLKFGIYSSPGPKTCGGRIASYQHELQDVKTWEKWGVDYLKYDWCSYRQIEPKPDIEARKKPYILMRKMLDKSSRDVVYSLCQYGAGDVWRWGAGIGGNLWRTTGDITDTWRSLSTIGFGQDTIGQFAGPGHWNDPDMLIVGKVGWGPRLHSTRLTPDEQFTHITLWSLLAAPMLIGCDMSQMDAFTLNLLTNDEVLEVNQDPLGKQAAPVKKENDFQIWSRPLEDGSLAVGIFSTAAATPVEAINWGEKSAPKKIRIDWALLGISGTHKARDLWRQKDLGEFTDGFEADVPFHGVAFIKILK